MKTKRLKKLLMGMGLSRNQANSMILDLRTSGVKFSNKVYYYYAKRYGAELLEPGWLRWAEDAKAKRPARAGNTSEPKGDGFLTAHHPKG